MYTITAYFAHKAYAECRCDTLAELVEYLTQWLPLAIRVECREVPTQGE
jgi:hypothetical protein